jgi:YbbR domain-containing protein
VRGRRQLILTATARQISPIPAGLNLEILDRIVQVTVDKSASKQVRIVPKLVGRLPQDVEVETVTTDPALVTVTGPVAVMQALNHVATEPIDLQSRRSSFATSVELTAPDPAVELDPDQVRVIIVLTPKSAKR